MVDAASIVTTSDNHTLYARWQGKEVKLYYNGNGGIVSEDYKIVYYDENYGSLATPTRTGYEFTGWYTESASGERIKESELVTLEESITIYAHWRLKTPLVAFEANGGTLDLTEKTVTYGEAYGQLPTPVKEGYTFCGWYAVLDGDIEITEETVVENEEAHTLYAYWVENGDIEEPSDEPYTYEEYLVDMIHPRLPLYNLSADSILPTDDFDGDGLTLEEEFLYNTNPFTTDTDEDGLSDYLEIFVYQTNPILWDTDQDGMSDGTEVFSGLNPLEQDTDSNGIRDSEEIIDQFVRLDSMEPFNIVETLVQPNIRITGKGDYSTQIYAQALTENRQFNEIESVVGTPYEFIHDENLTFDSSTLSFIIDESILSTTTLEYMKIAWYDEENNSFELLETTYNSASKSISAQVDHYSIYGVINTSLLINNMINDDAGQHTPSRILLSNYLSVELNSDPSLGDEDIDTDGDGIPDIYELKGKKIKQFVNPITNTTYEYEVWTFYSNPALADSDFDGIDDYDDFNPCRFDYTITNMTEDVIEFNSGNVWYMFNYTKEEWQEILLGERIDYTLYKQCIDIISMNAAQDFHLDELTIIAAFNNEGSRFYLDKESRKTRDTIYEIHFGEKPIYTQHRLFKWVVVPPNTSGGFWEGKVVSSADMLYSLKQYSMDAYDILEIMSIFGLVYVTINTGLFAVTSVNALVSYCKFYGIKTGTKYFMLLGPSNAPAGLVEKLKTEISEGNTKFELPKTVYNMSKLQHEYKHAGDFGIEGNWNGNNAKLYQAAIQNHIDTAPEIYKSTYRGLDVYVYLNQETSIGTYVNLSGNYIGGWKFNANQITYHLTNGIKIR